MEYLKGWKLFEAVETYQDLFEMYRDCFIDLIDMNIFISPDSVATCKSIELEAEDERNAIPLKSHYTKDGIKKLITIQIMGKANYNSNEHLTKVYNEYLVNQLEEDEYRFEKLSGMKLHNGMIKIDIKEWDVTPTSDRWKELVHDKNLQKSSLDVRVQYQIDSDQGNRPYAWYTYVVNSDRLKSVNSLLDDRNFIQRLFSKKKVGYKFPKLTDKMEVQNFHIIHYISE